MKIARLETVAEWEKSAESLFCRFSHLSCANLYFLSFESSRMKQKYGEDVQSISLSTLLVFFRQEGDNNFSIKTLKKGTKPMFLNEKLFLLDLFSKDLEVNTKSKASYCRGSYNVIDIVTIVNSYENLFIL